MASVQAAASLPQGLPPLPNLSQEEWRNMVTVCRLVNTLTLRHLDTHHLDQSLTTLLIHFRNTNQCNSNASLKATLNSSRLATTSSLSSHISRPSKPASKPFNASNSSNTNSSNSTNNSNNLLILLCHKSMVPMVCYTCPYIGTIIHDFLSRCPT